MPEVAAIVLYAAENSFKASDEEMAANGWAHAFSNIEERFPAIWTMLLDRAVVICSHSGVYSFQHHLYSDFFVAHAITRRIEPWGDSFFDVATIDASSADPLVLAMEILGQRDGGSADAFIDAIYDWNYGLAIEVLRDVAAMSGQLPVSVMAAKAIWFAQGEKLFDPVPETRKKAHVRLAELGDDLAQRVLQAAESGGMSAVLNTAAQGMNESERSTGWGRLYLTENCSKWGEVETEQVAETSSIVGWTCANVMRRGQLGAEEQRQLRTIGRHSARAQVRWRVVHALGAYPSVENLSFLLDLVENDQSRWVQFGAVRSALECAVKMDVSVDGIVKRISASAPRLSWIVLREVGAAIFVNGYRDRDGWISEWQLFAEAEVERAIDPTHKKYWVMRYQQLCSELGGRI